MTRIQPVDHATVSGQAKDLLDGVKDAIGMVPNLYATLAQSPTVLDGYLSLSKALGNGILSAQLREQIALTVAGINSCDYCASAHTALGKMAGLDDQELVRNLGGNASDAKTQAALNLTAAVVRKSGNVSDHDLKDVRAAGYSEGEIVEIVANVTANIFTNYFNHVAGTDIDFPVVTKQKAAA